MTKGYVSVDDIINDIQLMADDASYYKDAKIHQIRLLALRGIGELGFEVSQQVETTKIKVGSSLSASFPTGFVKELKIGFVDENREMRLISKSSNLMMEPQFTERVKSSSLDENNPYYHTDLGKKFGTGGGQNTSGYYRVNNNDNVIHFSSNLKGKNLLMEYIEDERGESKPKIHAFCEEALRCYIYYKYIQTKRNVPANEKQMAKRAYYNEKRLAKARMMNFSKEEAVRTSRKAFKQSPKI